MLVYGMGEQPLREIVNLLQKGVPFSSLKNIKQTAVLINQKRRKTTRCQRLGRRYHQFSQSLFEG